MVLEDVCPVCTVNVRRYPRPKTSGSEMFHYKIKYLLHNLKSQGTLKGCIVYLLQCHLTFFYVTVLIVLGEDSFI